MGALDQFGSRLAENLGITSSLDALRQGHPVPAYQVLVDGKDISTAIRPRLMSMTITDNRGFTADTIEITLDDSDGQLDMPRRGLLYAASSAGKAAPWSTRAPTRLTKWSTAAPRMCSPSGANRLTCAAA